jgi:hypothetical protein
MHATDSALVLSQRGARAGRGAHDGRGRHPDLRHQQRARRVPQRAPAPARQGATILIFSSVFLNFFVCSHAPFGCECECNASSPPLLPFPPQTTTTSRVYMPRLTTQQTLFFSVSEQPSLFFFLFVRRARRGRTLTAAAGPWLPRRGTARATTATECKKSLWTLPRHG